MFHRTELPDGPRVISARLPGSRSVSVAAYVLAGSRLESSAEAGVLVGAKKPNHSLKNMSFSPSSI